MSLKQTASEGFIGRWSRLKRETVAVEAPVAPMPVAAAPVVETPGKSLVAASPEPSVLRQASDSADQAARDGNPHRQPATVLPSIESLGKDSDYSMFMKANVDPQLRLSALKKMFTDPHFNQMDGLDIYIDDYSRPDPIPLAMLKRLNQSRMLNLFEEEPAKDASSLTTGQSRPDMAQDLQEPQALAAADESADPLAPPVLPATPGLPEPLHDAADLVAAPKDDVESPVSGKSA